MHCYWGTSRPLSCLRYMTVLSFATHNPDWKIKVWKPKDEQVIPKSWKAQGDETTYEYKNKDWFPVLETIPNVDICEYDFENTVVENQHDVFKSDFIRWNLLHDYGGLWSDFDILYTKPLDSLLENIDAYQDITCLMPSYNGTGGCVFPIGFILSAPKHIIFSKAIEACADNFRSDSFESIGNSTIHRVLGEIGTRDFLDITSECVYPILYNNLVNINDGKEWKNCIGCHWYGGAALMGKHEERIQNPELITDEISLRKELQQ